ncbi:MAG: hypothetical protein EON93_09980 [Burkholderiales bacterium]|nr:MAG: hypothetical protein EON93_09980 [Burkholderiales bacterium]
MKKLVVLAGLLAAACASRPVDPFPVPAGDGLFIMSVKPSGQIPNVRALAAQMSKANRYCSKQGLGLEIIVDEARKTAKPTT